VYKTLFFFEKLYGLKREDLEEAHRIMGGFVCTHRGLKL